ncbi:MAG: helix-turn-helix transcriptional regulator [Hungatella sp.]|nr:helix-turn-helix transcriptional regulator [Hungatella sp.]
MRKNLKEARQRAGMTQKQVAEYLGISEIGYRQIESNKRIGTIKIWDALEDLFHVNQRKLRENL